MSLVAKTIRIDYTPTSKQLAYHKSNAYEILYGGAAGGGKSKATVMDAFMNCMKYPGMNAYLFRRTYPELENTLIAEAMASIPEELYRYSNAQHVMRFQNGSHMYFRHMTIEADKVKYQGAEIHRLYIDELTHFTQSMYEYLKTRVRVPKRLGFEPKIRCTSNPGGIGHGWVKKYFVDRGEYGKIHSFDVVLDSGEKKTMTVQYIPALATDNPHLTEDYMFELMQKPEALRNALLHGRWDAFEGQVFVEWKDDPAHYKDRRWTHVIEPFEIPISWPRYMAFDHGYSKPFACVWFAVDPEGTAYIYREWYGYTGHPDVGLKLSPSEIAAGIVDREKNSEGLDNIHIRRVADPAIFDRSRGDSVADQMEPGKGKPGVLFEKGDNKRMPGKMQVHERLRFDEYGRPKLQVFNICKEVIRTLPALPYDETKPEDIDTGSEDHLYDAIRYFCMARPMPARVRMQPEVREYDPFEEEVNGIWLPRR